MKRSLPTSDSTDEHDETNNNNNPMYTMDFQTNMMNMEGLDHEDEELSLVSEKKRRLRVDQVKALEKNFEVENKLEPERKVKLAQELGLQPRQVAVWFQNRRARWKTKQLERDYGVLKANYDALKLDYDSLQRDNDSLINEIREIKSKLNGDDNKVSVKEEQLMSDSDEKIEKSDHEEEEEAAAIEANQNGLTINFGDQLKDGSSDSDSSAILNDQESPILHHIHNGSSSSSSMNITFQFSGLSKTITPPSDGYDKNFSYQPQFVKIEEHNFFGEESCCSLFTDDQAPTLHWYNSEDWN